MAKSSWKKELLLYSEMAKTIRRWPTPWHWAAAWWPLLTGPGSTKNWPRQGRPKTCCLGPVWTFPLKVGFTFVASSLDIYWCVLSYFDGRVNYIKVSFLFVVLWKYMIKYLQKCEGCTHFFKMLNVTIFLLFILVMFQLPNSFTQSHKSVTVNWSKSWRMEYIYIFKWRYWSLKLLFGREPNIQDQEEARLSLGGGTEKTWATRKSSEEIYGFSERGLNVSWFEGTGC